MEAKAPANQQLANFIAKNPPVSADKRGQTEFILSMSPLELRLAEIQESASICGKFSKK
jgi:hypothetical protein